MSTAAGPTTALINIQVPLADEDLINHRLNILKQVLPSPYQPAESLVRAITQMVLAIMQKKNNNHQAWEEKAV
jgi:hypothetical protein